MLNRYKKSEWTQAKQSFNNSNIVSIIGAGNWGTALAILLANNGCHVRLWDQSPRWLSELAHTRRHPRLAPEVVFPENITFADTIDHHFLDDSAFVLLAITSNSLPEMLLALKTVDTPALPPLVVATKGLQKACFFQDALNQIFDQSPEFALLSGPSFAREVVMDIDTTVVLASQSAILLRDIPVFFQTKHFHIELSHDVLGVQLCGAMKNVIAIASGMGAGRGLGENYRACLLVQGLEEMLLLGRALGASAETFHGLAGLGDLCLTAHSQQSRNFRFGFYLGIGDSAAHARAQIGEAIEGIEAARDIHLLAQKHKLLLPICTEVYEAIKNLDFDAH